MAQQPHADEIKARISGFTPATTGTICDMSNQRISAGEDVHLELEKQGRIWEIVRTHCAECEMELDSSHPEIAQAIVTAEAMQSLDGGQFVTLGNPDVQDVSPEGEARGEWADVVA